MGIRWRKIKMRPDCSGRIGLVSPLGAAIAQWCTVSRAGLAQGQA